MTQAKYLADLLALQVLNTNVAYCINRGDCDALADYFVDDAKYEADARTSKGRDAIVAWFRARSDAPQRLKRIESVEAAHGLGCDAWPRRNQRVSKPRFYGTRGADAPGRIPAGAMTGSWAPWPILATGFQIRRRFCGATG